LAENFVRAMGAAQVTYEDDRAQGHQRAGTVRPALRCSTTVGALKRFVARKRLRRAEDKAVETPRTFSFSLDEA
jgi:hypothetical protein